MAETTQLKNIMYLLHRRELSQAEICQELNLSKSHVSALVKSLEVQGLICRTAASAGRQGGMGRPRELLRIYPQLGYTALLINMRATCRCFCFEYGNPLPVYSVELPRSTTAAELISRTQETLTGFMTERQLTPADFLVFLVAETGIVEHGFHGQIFTDRVLTDTLCPLPRLMTEATGIPTAMCNLAYGHQRCILEKLGPGAPDALFFMCGEGAVGLGIMMRHEIIMGSCGVFPECSHLNYAHGFEASLGTYGEHTADALFFAITQIAPIFMTDHIIVSGVAFEGHSEVVTEVMERLKQDPNPYLRGIEVSYVPVSNAERLREYACLTFDLAVDLKDPQPVRRSLNDLLVSKRRGR